MTNKKKSNAQRKVFFDKIVIKKEWKKNMTGDNEEKVIECFSAWGYKENEDYVPQFPLIDKYVADFAFIKAKVLIEVDDPSHSEKTKSRLDIRRDRQLLQEGWVTIRIPESKFFNNRSFYKHLIHFIVEEQKLVLEGLSK